MQGVNHSTNSVPCLDVHNNPFYCPAIPANNFLASLRRRRERLRFRVHTYNNQRFILKSFAAALDRCLFRGGGDSDDDTQPIHCQDGSEEELSDDLHNTIPSLGTALSAHTSGKHGLKGIKKGLRGVKNAFLRSGAQNTASDSFVTVPLDPTTSAKASALSRLASLNDRSGKPLIPAWDNRILGRRTGILWEKISLGTNAHKESHISLKRKSDESDTASDSESPVKRARSNLSVSDGSFYVTVKREKLRFVRSPSSSLQKPSKGTNSSSFKVKREATEQEALESVLRYRTSLNDMRKLDHDNLVGLAQSLQEELFGTSLGSESQQDIMTLVGKLDSMIPGIRIKERLVERLKGGTSHQVIVNLLAENGHLNSRVLEVFRASKVTRISLNESLNYANGLNLISDELFFVFSKPNSFRFLTDLSLDGLCLQTSMISHIQHLPKLARLSLYDSGINNECVYLLLPLKRTLLDLNIARNPQIDDDVVPALLMMVNLSYLSLAETFIDMPGARRLANDQTFKTRRVIIDFPQWCHEYVDKMEHQYLLELPPPLVSNPSLCDRLSSAALKRNLVAHSVVNPEIGTSGTKKEMAERLKNILQTRLYDLEVRRMIRCSEDTDSHSMADEA
ncbi:hypothetical protein AX17_002594 [Amanita inopinata Kibby_2008]|nr:hypothetical protein AX17_002594 [Amanita inopinata Kibby_2008]